jgi:hypothetical protein
VYPRPGAHANEEAFVLTVFSVVSVAGQAVQLWSLSSGL